MSLGDFTLNDMVKFTKGNAEAQIRFRLYLAESASEILQLVDEALSLVIRRLVANRQYHQGLSEDQITNSVVDALNYLGFIVHHDKMVGGHCDITIEMDFGFLWLAEAKIWRGCSWAFKGFRQLLTRYSTGITGQNDNVLLLYVFRPDALTLLEKWRSALNKRLSLGLTAEPITGLEFATCHKHPSSGLDVNVKHVMVPLYWKPEA